MNLIEHSLDLQIPMNPSYDHLFRNSPDAVSIPVKKEIDSHLLGLVHLKGDKTMTKLAFVRPIGTRSLLFVVIFDNSRCLVTLRSLKLTLD